PASVPATITHTADDPDSAGGGSSNPAGSATPMAGSAASNTACGAFGAKVTDSTVTTTATMDSAGSRRQIGVSPFADSVADPSPFISSIAGGPSPSYVSTAQIPIAVLFESTSGGINDFFLKSDEEEQIGMSRVVANPDSDDKVLAEIIFRGKSISGDGVVLVDKLPDDEIVDPRVKVETVSEFASSPPRSRRKHLGVRSDDFLWDKPVEDFFSSESESDDDMENYIPPLPYGAFKDWEILLPHVYREDLLLLRRRMNRYFRLNPEVDVGLELWRDVNMLCQSLHSNDCGRPFGVHREWFVSSGPVLLFFDVATSFDSTVHRVHVVSFDAVVFNVAATVSAAAGSPCICCYSILLLREDLSRNLELTESKPMVSAGSSSSIPADYVPAGHVLISADRYRIC
ncbi:hypothetical protein Tco_0757129, partial [Tanacetum coccineum]